MIKLIISFGGVIPVWLTVCIGFVLAFGLTFRSIPAIVGVARLKNLCATPNSRTSHLIEVPTLGGVAIFIGFVSSTIILACEYFTPEFFYIFLAINILFFTGLKDDILAIDPKKKLAAQIIVAVIIVFFSDVMFINLYQKLGLGTVSSYLNIATTILFLLVIINGFNLIDGIDGLASGAGIVSSTAFGIWFWSEQRFEYTVMSFALAGSLGALFIYNVFGKKNKIFLGDTGSMLIGLIIGVLAIQSLEHDNTSDINPSFQLGPALVFGILILPLFDTLRIFIVRIYQGKSPFIADHQHIHHKLLELGLSHLQSTLVLLSVNIFFIVFCTCLQGIGSIPLILLVLAISTIMSVILLKLVKKKAKIHIRVVMTFFPKIRSIIKDNFRA